MCWGEDSSLRAVVKPPPLARPGEGTVRRGLATHTLRFYLSGFFFKKVIILKLFLIF